MMNPIIESLLTFADQAALELLVWSWQALVLLACVWAGMKLFRVKTPSLRQQIWLISMLAVLTLPVWPPLFPKSTSPQQQPRNSSALSYAAELPRMIIVPAAEARLPITDYKALTMPPKKGWLSKVLPAAFCLWLAGALFALSHSIRGYLRLRRASRHACPTTPEELGSALELPQAVSLSLSADVRSPVLLGLRHPVILLPHDLAEWTSVEEREAMIAHELAHVARFDHFTNMFPLALNVIFFFHPLVRYASRQFCLEREMACDDRVIGDGADAAMYAESLVKAAERSVKGKLDDLASHSLHQPAFFTSKQALERRIEMILNTERVRLLARGWRYLIVPAALIVALAWMLVPNRPATAQQLQKQLDNAAASMKDGSLKELLGRYMTDTAVYDNLVNTVLSESDGQLREQALLQLVGSPQEWASVALGEIYDKTGDLGLRNRLIGYLGQRRAMSRLIALAVEEPNDQLRQQAVQRLLEMEGADTGGTLVDLYTSVHERAVRESIIRRFGQRADIDGLHSVGDVEEDMELRQLIVQQLEWVAANTSNADARREALDQLQAIRLDTVKRSVEIEIMEKRKRFVETLSDISIKDDSNNEPQSLASILLDVKLGPISKSRHAEFGSKCIACHLGKSPTLLISPHSDIKDPKLWNDPVVVAQLLREDPNQNSIVLALLLETFDATIRRDTDFLGRALANEFQSFGPYSEVKNKDQIIAEVSSNNLKIDRSEIGDLNLSGEGNSMVATFAGTSFYQEEGKEKKKQYRYTILCLKRRGGWQIVSLHRSPVR
jgi:beta-lactamase regulating signal transducer with metallopeptidase domain